VKVGKHYGAGNPIETKQVILYALVIASATASAAGLVFWLLPDVLVDLFVDEALGPDEYQALVALASLLLLIGAMFQLVDGWQVVLMGVLRGFKLGASPTIVATVSYWGLGFPAAYFLGEMFGPAGVWAGMGLGLGLSAILLFGLVVKTYKRVF